MDISGLHFFSKRLPEILQTESSECGLACLAMVATFHGHATDLAEMRKKHYVSLKGITLGQLCSIAERMGFTCRALRLDLDEMGRLQTPAILHWDMNHFVVLREVSANSLRIHDPACGDLRVPMAEASRRFTGVALELSPGFDFIRKPPPPPLALSRIVGRTVGLRRTLTQMFVLALALEVLALLTPIITQWITDDAVVSGDRNLLAMLGLGLLGIGLGSVAVTAMRTWVSIYASTHFNLQWMSNVMAHLLRLPMSYFERRHMGDIVSRFGSVGTLIHTLTASAVETVLDGLLAIGTISMMFAYSPELSVVTLLAVLVYAGLRSARYGSLRMASVTQIAKHAREQSFFLETLRGVRAIKLFNRERERRNGWLSLWVEAVNADLAIQRINLIFSSGWGLLSTFERATVLWLGGVAVLDHRMSLGMLFAFLGFKEQFSGRVSALVDRVFEFKMMSVSMERLADIVTAKPEEETETREGDADVFDLGASALVFEKVTFQYGRGETKVLDAASLRIEPGESVAIVGNSGAGKTTFVKLLLGILTPTSGAVMVGEHRLDRIGLRRFRELVGTVMQDDILLAGTILDNITFLDPHPDVAWAQECASVARINGEILAMPMGYHTLVGDMGAALSGGQKQRILLARALYAKPRILVLDEATSHLDIENERMIGQVVSSLRLTRIMIAHRPQTIAVADRVLRLEGGRFVELDGDQVTRMLAGSATQESRNEVL
jgi:ATP-binding cassette subfamily B protein RaxB